MDANDAEFQKKLLLTFKIEAEEHLNTLSSGLLELEKISEYENQIDIIETIYRDSHSLKGAARVVNLTEIEKVCQSMENVFSALKSKGITVSSNLFDLLYEAIDALSKIVSMPGEKRTIAGKTLVRELIKNLDDAANGTLSQSKKVETHGTGIDIRSLSETVDLGSTDNFISPSSSPSLPLSSSSSPPLSSSPSLPLSPPSTLPFSSPSSPPCEQQETQIKESVVHDKSCISETIRITTTKLDEILVETEELVYAKLMAAQHENELVEISASLSMWQKQLVKIQPDIKKIKHLIEISDSNTKDIFGEPNSKHLNLVEFFDANYANFKALESKITAFSTMAEFDHRVIDAMVDTLLEDIKEVLMHPLSSLLEIYPRFVRKLSHEQGKDVEFITQGDDLEIDRRILEEMKDPFMHIIRNFVDHGIEKPDKRIQKNKPGCGTIRVSISQKSGNKVKISISDDGTGIDLEKVKASAIKSGIISSDEAKNLNTQDILSLLFQSGVTTSSIITDISGRGLGLAIVRENVEKIGGEVHVETQQGVGTTFNIILPLTLSTFRGVLVRLGEQSFIIPTVNVARVKRILKYEIRTVESIDTIQFEDMIVPLIHLESALGMPMHTSDELPDKLFSVILFMAGKHIAFLVDEIVTEQEVLVKSLGSQITRAKNITSATVLGSGKVVPIINVSDLMKSAMQNTVSMISEKSIPKKDGTMVKSVLIVEDSITSRTFIKNILESANYHVVTAYDGVDGFTKLNSEQFDIVISDVEMPRMNGFELTAKIRNHKKFAELPVILVTSLQSRTDRERGIKAGANAYIVKSSFDQSNLLEVVGRIS